MPEAQLVCPGDAVTQHRQASDAGARTRRRRSGSVAAWVRRHGVLTACAATALAHLLFLTRKLDIDEGGFAMVARYQHHGGGYLYGPQWVDRPPALLAFFDLAGQLGAVGVRVGAGLAAVVLVGAVAVAARAVAGPAAAAWSAWTAFAFASSALLAAEQLNGELLAAMCVALSFAGLLVARRDDVDVRLAVLSAGGAGLSAAVAVCTKQNFVDGLVFAVVLLVATGLRSRRRGRVGYRRLVAMCSGFAAAALTVVVAVCHWAGDHGGVSVLLYAMYGFRRDASFVLAQSWAEPVQRLGILSVVALGTGLAVLGGHLLVCHRRLLRLSPPASALCAAALVEAAGVLGGGNFWPHYLIGLVPTVALGAGLAAAQGPAVAARRTRALVVYAVLATCVASPVAAVVQAVLPSAPYTSGRWLARSSRPADTLVVPYTHANVIDASGLTPVYPYSWSLPLRTLDPRLELLRRPLDSDARPTWVFVWDRLQDWDLDSDHRVEGALRRHYRRVARVCGHDVWLRRDAQRHLAALPPAAAC